VLHLWRPLLGDVLEGVREVFETATRAALQVKKKKQKKCVLV
jgi:hypothetical protein